MSETVNHIGTGSRRFRIGLDFDDTLMHTREALVEILNEIHGTSATPEECTDYYLSTPWKLSDEQFTAFFNANEARIHTQPPLEGILETLAAWQPHADFYVVTGRPLMWLPSATTWLESHGIAVKEIISARTMGGKGNAAKLRELDFFIDDHFDFAQDIAKAGIPVFLLDRPYNRELSHPMIYRVKDWGEIRDKYVPKMFGLRVNADNCSC